ncbi:MULTISPECIES: sensor histidine kinase [Kitasatospora]|uniref:histidine kinase n=1 Tax=Kitasatospora cystarginea TaxID=58350 RepID=A0ABN3F079_9ACTN
MTTAWRGSLRARLMTGVILLAALGMVAVNAASLLALRLYLIDAADAQLTKARATVEQHVTGRTTPISAADVNSLMPGGAYVVLLDGHGRVVAQTPAQDFSGRPIPRPDLPDPIPDGYARHAVTVSGRGAPTVRYRTLVFSVGTRAMLRTAPGASLEPFSTVVAATSLGPGDDVVYWLVCADAVATLTVLAGIALVGRGVLRVSLRPLRDMAGTATAIADGDLGQRIQVAQQHSELGEVGTALNRAFDARQRSEERLRQFVADASHELRTPLTSIRGWAQLHLHGLARDPELLDRAMLRIESEAARMHAMVEELLLLARLDQGRPLASAPVDLGALAGYAVCDTLVLDPDRPITLDVPGRVMARGDEERLRQVLGNLLNNVLRHTPPGTPAVVAVRALPHEGTVELTVADEGPGMDGETASRVFERFYRGDDSRAPGSGGTGLGLGIVKSIAEAHGGKVSVRTAPGEGSIFTFVLPGCPGLQVGEMGVPPPGGWGRVLGSEP